MSEASEVFGFLAETTDAHTTDDGVDVVNIFGDLIEALKASGEMTVELWEDLKLSINNCASISSNMIDQEISKLKEEV